MALSWIHYETTCDQTQSRYRSLVSQESHSRKTAMRSVRCGRSFRTCFQVNVSNVSPTCSFTAASSHERLFASVQESSVRCKKSIASGATSWSDCSATQITFAGSYERSLL